MINFRPSSLSLLITVIVTLVAVIVKVPDILFRVEYPIPISSSSSSSLSNGAIFITGTSKGIGQSICQHLAEHRPTFHIYCGVRKLLLPPNDDNTTSSLFNGTYPNIHPIVVDITNDEQVYQAVETIRQNGHELVGVINNAGVINLGTVEFQPMSSWEQVIGVNVLGTVRVTQAVLPDIRRNNGRIIIIGSSSSVVGGMQRYGSYQASKYAVEVISDTLRSEVAEHNVSVSLIQPGIIQTDMSIVQTQTTETHVPINEQQAYPWLYVKSRYMEFLNKFVSVPGPIDDTLHAIDHALFDRYPKTKYLTSWFGFGPTWLCAPLLGSLPDRVADSFKAHPELALAVMNMIF